jgi:alanine racemase
MMEPVSKPANIMDYLKKLAKLTFNYLGYARFAPPVVFPGGTGKIVGKVGMQLTMVDVSTVKDLNIGTVAGVPIRRTAVGNDIPRAYVQDGRIISVIINKMDRGQSDILPGIKQSKTNGSFRKGGREYERNKTSSGR